MMPPEEWDEAGKWTSAAQAVFLLAGFFAAVVFAGDLNFRPPLIVSAPPVWLVSPPPPAQVVKKEETPAPESRPAPPPETADIALKKTLAEEKRKEEERKEAERKKREERERKERERKEREEEERQLAEKKRKEEEERKKREEEERKERERIAEQREEEERQRAEESAEAAARAEILGRLKDNYVGRIRGRIEPFLTPPPSADGIPDLEVILEVRLSADGDLEGFPEVVETSGVPDYDEVARRAVLNAAPLPMPKEPELLEEFRILTLRITPKK